MGWAILSFVFKVFGKKKKKKKALAVFHPNTTAGRGGGEGEAAWLIARKNADNVREPSWEKYLFLERRKGEKQQALRVFLLLLLSLSKTGEFFAASDNANASLLTVEGVCISLTLWKASLRLTQFIAWSFHADQHPWDSPLSPGAPRRCETVLPFLRLGNTLGLAAAP